jgi:hypothetical protein
MPNTRHLKQFVELTRKKRDLEAQLREVETALLNLDATLCDELAEAGMKSCSIDGMTVYLHRRVTVGVAEGHDKQELIEQLKAEGLENCVSLQHNALAAAVKEATDPDTGELTLSTKLQELLKIGEVVKVAARNSN